MGDEAQGSSVDATSEIYQWPDASFNLDPTVTAEDSIDSLVGEQLAESWESVEALIASLDPPSDVHQLQVSTSNDAQASNCIPSM
ncbi:hypothetical protein V5O48_018965 [Marasmius crinis-equi]|uniref:Uncharacterized protein n=1 Tax=Marasmius crinis-equi TaxID=585013 RepID=A0ABR3EJT4_9AGAR